MKLQIQNLIPKYQQSNQKFANLRQILETLPVLPNESNVYARIRSMIQQKPQVVRVDVKNGIHTREGDSWHFNMAVYDKRARLHELVYDTVHVYVTPNVIPDSRGNPVLWWSIDPYRGITG